MKTTIKQGYTPGPWEVDSGMVQTEADVLGTGIHVPICYMDRNPGNGTLPVERDANAQFIAAAPDLLEACKKALTCGLDSSVRQLIITAIARAEGKS